MGYKTFDRLDFSTENQNSGFVLEEMTLSHSKSQTGGEDVVPETGELKNVESSVDPSNPPDPHVMNQQDPPTEVRDSSVDESENEMDMFNRVKAAADMFRLLPAFVRSGSSALEGEESCIDINELIESLSGHETSCSIISQISLPFVIAGFGTVGAGIVLDTVQHWDVFLHILEIFILVPALLGLKGNLEMTLASRLSTQAHLGNMDTKKELVKMIFGNMILVQAQAIVVGFLSSLTAVFLGWIPGGEFRIRHGVLLCAASLFTASLASFLLGVVMVIVVMLSRYFQINPDNIATPIAASLGDLVTLSVLALAATGLYDFQEYMWFPLVIIIFFLLLLPLWVTICIKNKYTEDVIFSGWVPVLSAMVISSLGGLILRFTISRHTGIAAFQPIINGVGGNLVAIHASRISTSLHMKGRPRGQRLKGCLSVWTVFFGHVVHARAARILVFLTVPGHLLFSIIVFYLSRSVLSTLYLFEILYISAALLQVILLIYTATWLVPLIWARGSDPDNVAIPYLTAFGDLLGTGFLAVAFYFSFTVTGVQTDFKIMELNNLGN